MHAIAIHHLSEHDPLPYPLYLRVHVANVHPLCPLLPSLSSPLPPPLPLPSSPLPHSLQRRQDLEKEKRKLQTDSSDLLDQLNKAKQRIADLEATVARMEKDLAVTNTK